MAEILFVFYLVYLKTVCNYFVCCKMLFVRSVLKKCCKTDLAIWATPANPHKYWVFRHIIARVFYSHSIRFGHVTKCTPRLSSTNGGKKKCTPEELWGNRLPGCQ